MASSKSIPKVGPNCSSSFGGYNQARSNAPGQNPAAKAHSEHAGINLSGSVLSNLASDSANLSLRDEEFPQLGKAPSASSKSNVLNASVKSHSSSRQIQQEWLIGEDEEDRLQDRISSKNKRKGPNQKHAAGEGENRTSASQDRIYFLGRLLTNILRHKATHLKLQVRNDGYVVVSDMLKLDIRTRPGIPLKAYTVDDILKAVERDNKHRFTLLTEDGVLLIRANQGHSINTIESDKLLKPVLSADEIPVCIHGTLMRNLSSIMKFGLKKMGRNHVHFASGLPRENGVISGMRHTSEVLIYLDSKKALQDGMQLYMSDNGVILTEGYDGVVPPEYFERIAKWDNGKISPLALDTKA